MQSAVRVGARTASAGAVSDELFKASFESVPDIRVNSLKEFIFECQKYAAILENVNNDWNKRVKALQSLRSLIKHDIGCYVQYAEQAYQILGTAFELSIKDLRSQVCRETCITLSYYCMKLGNGFWRVAESVLPITMNLSQNSAKVMSTSAHICNNYIATYVRYPKIINIIIQHNTHKAKEVRRVTISLIALIISTWEAHILERHWPELLQSIKTGLNDADQEVRVNARQSFENLQNLYPHKAEALFQELEPVKQRILTGRISAASSTHSITSERDNLPNPNRGLYNAQNAFLNKRSASDLNHSIRRLNIAPSKNPHRPNVIRSGKPPQVGSNAPRPAPSTPLTRKIPHPPIPILQSANRATKYSSSASQPGSRSTSPNRRPLQQNSGVNLPAPSNVKRVQNGTPGPAKMTAQSAHKEIVRALKNVDTHARAIRPNVIRSDDPRAYVNMPNSNSETAKISRMSNSPQDFYGLSHKQEAALSRINNSEDAGLSNNRRKSSSHTSSTGGRHSSAGNLEHSSDKWSYITTEMLAKDPIQQATFVQEVCELLTGKNENEKDVEGVLLLLSRFIREGGITQWDELFNDLFLSVIKVVSDQKEAINKKIISLRILRELCNAQPKKLVIKTELLFTSILNAHENDDASVVRAAEECGAVMATKLPANTCVNLLLTVIDDRNSKYHQLAGAIKMLSQVILKLPKDEVFKLLPRVARSMTEGYTNEQSIVRRACILCLMNISSVVGLDALEPHVTQQIVKLVQVYRERMGRKDASGNSS